MPAMLTKGRIYEDPDELAQALRDLRARRDITQKEAAEISGVHFMTWVQWENRLRFPKPITQRGIRTIFPDF